MYKMGPDQQKKSFSSIQSERDTKQIWVDRVRTLTSERTNKVLQKRSDKNWESAKRISKHRLAHREKAADPSKSKFLWFFFCLVHDDLV